MPRPDPDDYEGGPPDHLVALVNEAARHTPPLAAEDPLALALWGYASRDALSRAKENRPLANKDYAACTMAAVRWGVATAQPFFARVGWIPPFDPKVIGEREVREGGVWFSTFTGRVFAPFRYQPETPFVKESMDLLVPPAVFEPFVAVRFTRWLEGPLHDANEAFGRVIRSMKSASASERTEAWARFLQTREGMLSALFRDLMAGTAGVERARLMAEFRKGVRMGGGNPSQDLQDCIQELAAFDAADEDLRLFFPGEDGYMHLNTRKIRDIAGRIAGVHRVSEDGRNDADSGPTDAAPGAEEATSGGRERRIRVRLERSLKVDPPAPPVSVPEKADELAMARAIRFVRDQVRDDPASLAALDVRSGVLTQEEAAAQYGVPRKAIRHRLRRVEDAIRRAFRGAA